MAASSTLTYDLATPRRPSLDDVGGATLVDSQQNPPHKSTMPYADQLNELQRQSAAVGKVVGTVLIAVSFASGVPFIAGFSPLSMVLIPGDFVLADVGAGHTTITWAANKLPTPVTPPMATVNADGDYTISVIPSANSVTVKTRLAGVLADAAFTIEIK